MKKFPNFRNFILISIFVSLFLFYLFPVLFNLDSKTFGHFGDKMGLIAALEKGEHVLPHQPVLGGVIEILFEFLAPFAVYNLLVLLSFPLTAFFAHRFFRRFFDFWISFALALVFTFSPYHILKIYNHLDLAQIWVFPLCFSALLDFDKDKSLRNTLELGGLLALTTLVSNYYGYFMLLIVGFFFLIRAFQSSGKNVLAHFGARRYLLLIVFYLLLIVPFLFPYLRANYLEGALPSPDGLSLEVKRGVSDFVTFTARPWYFVTPSVYHPVFGKFAEGVHDWFWRTGYFLFDDFFAQEHSGIFLGWMNLVLAAYAVIKGKNSGRVWTFFWLAIVLALLSGPPFFTVSGFKIYLPSYLLMKVFPMFRTLARLGVPILLCVLVLTGYGLNLLKEHLHDRHFLSMLLTTSYLLLALFEFYNPPTIVDVPERGSPEYNQLLEK